ncbi:MAG: hypothetical protein R3B60_02060 [Candidatus Paceibacterota bacterium]
MTYSILSNQCPEFVRFRLNENGIMVTINKTLYDDLELVYNNQPLQKILGGQNGVSVAIEGKEVSFEIKLPFLSKDMTFVETTVYPNFQKLNQAAEILSVLTQTVYERFKEQDNKKLYALSNRLQLMFFQTFFSRGHSSFSATRQDIVLELSDEVIELFRIHTKKANGNITLIECEKKIYEKYCLLTSESLKVVEEKLKEFNPALHGLRIGLLPSSLLNIKVPNASGSSDLQPLDKSTGTFYHTHNLSSSLDLITMMMAIIEFSKNTVQQ